MNNIANHRNRVPWFPLSTRPLVMMVLVTACSAAVMSEFLIAWPPPTWVGWQAHFRDGQIGAAAAGSFMGAVIAKSFDVWSVIAPPCASRPKAGAVIQLIGWPCLANAFAYCLGMAPSTVITAMHASYGTPDLLAVSGTLVNVAAWPAFGAMVAMVVVHPLSALFALAASEIAIMTPIVLSNTIPGFSALAVAPIWQLDFPFVGERANPWVAISRLTLFLVVFCCLIVVVVVRASDGHREGMHLRAYSWLVFPAALSVIIVAFQPNIIAIDHRLSAVCATEGRITACVAESYRDTLPIHLETAHDVYDAFGPPGPITIIGMGLEGRDLKSMPGIEPRMLDAGEVIQPTNAIVETRKAFERDLRGSLIDYVSGGPACDDGGGMFSRLSAFALGEHIDDYLRLGKQRYMQSQTQESRRSRHTGSDGTDPFDADADTFDLAAWYDAHRSDVLSCALNEKDFS
ncbi:hypothetical protein EMB92_02320 [Bifidobacterium callitrichos]|uniref:Uncharacterized protein n=1 Tax=Bifidobacterium callitrichos TaxID=762209 RepID=A0A5M9ZE57_9BIFI|nr:hypothetical protein [Bifidobacterium callitrichos]KAA8817420.1 hypothetical protein EMB92_02320 [Bifidobacterium callitrichos]